MKKIFYVFLLILGVVMGYTGASLYGQSPVNQKKQTQDKELSATIKSDNKTNSQKIKNKTTKEPKNDVLFDHESYLLGFRSIETENSPKKLTFSGELPKWLKGTYTAVGPGKFEIKNSKATHWLDGFAMVHQFDIDTQTINYRNHLVDSTYHKNACERGYMRGSKPDENQSSLSRFFSAVTHDKPKRTYDNTNVNMIQLNNQLIALTETPDCFRYDLKKGKSKKFKFDDSLDGQFSSAHPLYDTETKEWFNFTINFGHNSDYIIYKIKDGSKKREQIAKISAPYPAYMHSFALTKKYIILTEMPFTVSPYDLLLSDRPFIENFMWYPKQQATFIVVNRKDGKLAGKYKTDSFFALHHINAFDAGNSITLDIATYDSPSIIQACYMEKIQKPNHVFPLAHMTRYIIDLDTKKVTHKLISEQKIEFPRCNHESCIGKEYQYVYGTGSDSPHFMSNRLVKINTKDGSMKLWCDKNCFPSEPYFIPAPQAQSEDDGIILSVVLDGKSKSSFLLALDAKELKELARAQLTHHIPFTLHGNFKKS